MERAWTGSSLCRGSGSGLEQTRKVRRFARDGIFSSVLSPMRTFPGRVRNELSLALRIAERRTQGNQRTDLDRPCFAFFDLGTKLSTAKYSNFPLGLVL